MDVLVKAADSPEFTRCIAYSSSRTLPEYYMLTSEERTDLARRYQKNRSMGRKIGCPAGHMVIVSTHSRKMVEIEVNNDG
jgi:hypothetical protein